MSGETAAGLSRARPAPPDMPPSRTLGLVFAAAAIGAGLAQLALQLAFRQVRHPVPLGAANLEPDAEVVRGWYSVLIEQGTYLWMIRTELVDLVWPVMLALAIVSLYRLVAGLLRGIDPPISRWLYRWAPVWLVGPAFDIVENAFSLAMLTDPFGFPDWWAVAHVAASWVKIAGSVASAVVGPTLTVVALARRRRGRRASDGREALSPR